MVAFNLKCPHLGCAIDYRKQSNDYFCPCHNSLFALMVLSQQKTALAPDRWTPWRQRWKMVMYGFVSSISGLISRKTPSFMKFIFDWLDDRSGYRNLLHEVLYEKVPGGARWRYVWGSCLTFAFFTQVVTGTLLWMFYSPSAQTAWESVYFLQYQVWGGWFLRGVHHYMAQAMIVLLVLHLMQVVIDGAYRAPRELNFWFGALMMGVTPCPFPDWIFVAMGSKRILATAVATESYGRGALDRTSFAKNCSWWCRVWTSYIDPFLCFACGGFACDAHWSGCGSYLSVPQTRNSCKRTATQKRFPISGPIKFSKMRLPV